jgi:regulator of replication initiation timing
VPEGSVDMQDFENKWAQPGVAIPYDPTDGPPVPVQPTPLPTALYQNETTAKNDIDHQLGIYEMMQGNAAGAPQTYKATISLDEFGQRKIKSKLADIESALVRLGQVAIEMAQQLYTVQKTFRIVNPNNSMTEYTINKKLVDDKSQEVKIINDITIGKYDLVVVAGSTLPSNRYAELEFYMDAYAKGLVDRQEVLKKTEVFDIEGVMQRMDTIAQLQQQLQQAGEQIKSLKGDLQTRDRESVNLRKKMEVEKFKGDLDKTKNKSQAAATVFDKRLDDELRNIRTNIATASKEAKK